MDKCEHQIFRGNVRVGRLTGEGSDVPTAYTAELTIKCAECGRDFQFLGLPAGVNLSGATMSIDGLEARLAIAPVGDVPSPLDKLAIAVPPKGTKH